MAVIVKMGIFFLNIIFSFLKLLPVRKKIVYISRQSNTVPVDFELMKCKMENLLPNYKNIVLARTIDPGVAAKIRYFFHMFRQMYHLATARVVILDTYCIAVSVLKQRESLIVVQMWHALGALKKFGYSILDKGEGSSSKIAGMMKMHNNYSYVFTSGELCREYFAEAFHQPLKKIKVFPLPRLDLLLNEGYQKKKKNSILKKYPILQENKKKIIVYAPTFRKDEEVLERGLEQLLSRLDYEKYYLIFKPHPLSAIRKINCEIICDKDFSTEDMLYIADYVITDYSAILYEAALLGKRMILYAFDYASYTKKRDFYLDYQSVFSDIIAKTADEVINLLEHNLQGMNWDVFLENVVKKTQNTYTADICNFLIESCKLK